MKIERLLFIVLASQISALAQPPAQPRASTQPKVMTWNVDGVKREAIVYSPMSKAARGRIPVVLAFHGHGDTADNYQGVGLHENWPQAVVVYPQGLDSARDGAPGWQVEKGKDADRDLKLVDQMLAALRQQYSVDDTRIYATGRSEERRVGKECRL